MTDQEFIDWLRFWLGNIDASVVTDDVLQLLLDQVKQQNPSATDCQIKYYFAIAVLGWLIRSEAKGSAGQAGSGAIKKKMEKTGQIQVTTEYDVGVSSGESTGWEAVLEDLKANPNSVGCIVFNESEQVNSGSVLFGGVSQKEYDRVKNDPDSRNGWCGVVSPYRDTPYNNTKNNRGFF